MRILVLAVVAALAVGGIAFYQWREPTKADLSAQLDSDYGTLTCDKESGLPGAAAGKMYHVVGTLETPIALDGKLYRSGGRVFLGYCDANGKLLP